MPDEKTEAQINLAKFMLHAVHFQPGSVFEHYKGGIYSIVSLSIKEDTYEPMVTYHSNANGTNWTRTLANFTEIVDNGIVCTMPDGSTRIGRPRFARLKK